MIVVDPPARFRPRRGVALSLIALPALLTLCPCTRAMGAPGPITLGARLRASGRAECRFVRVSTDPLTRRVVRLDGRVMLELPSRARLDFPATGERVTLRADGGEWLEPRLRQMVVFDSVRAAGARRWWQLLSEGAAPGVMVERRAGGHLVLRSEGGAGPDSARLDLDAAGLPVRLVIPDGESQVEFRFARWSFIRGQAPALFRQQAPPGFERVELP